MLKAASVTIVRDGVLTNIDEAALCKGDTLVFQAGDLVPADLRLVEAKNLQVDEFELTGEIMPVSKRVDGGDSDATVYRGSRVLKGTGKGIVLATGDETEYGRVLRQPWQRRRHFTLGLPDRRQLLLVGLLLPPLVGSLSKSPDWALISACYVLLALVILLLQNDELLRYMLVSSELKRMDRSRIDILDWTALERMGDIDTICFDKTGVLTSRHIEVKHVYADGELSNRDLASGKYDPSNLITTACALCNDVLYYEGLGRTNPVDRALISFATRNGIDFGEFLSKYERVYHEPFESERRHMVCGFRESEGRLYYFAKGDPAVILAMCRSYLTSSGVERGIDPDFYSTVLSSLRRIDESGDIPIALAYCANPADEPPSGYTFLCLLQLGNPVVPGTRELMGDIRRRGIRSVMLTGDRAETATRVAAEAGIAASDGRCLTGKVMERMAVSDVSRQADYCSVFARLLPSHKAVLIRLFQQKGHRVAMVGDGPNDGLALRAADVGVSFAQDASQIARRLSAIIIDELPDLVRVIEAGRRVRQRARCWAWLRVLVTTVSLCSTYFWAASSFV